ncbi:hypothetical protein ACOI1H_23880 [Loktanella sp. DJP18]|uniref:hypothetical protein n=1 Tax=Loktanella sp. DJP18 TaxID=3409788 RepID=UPI003BB4EC99
MPKPLDFDRLKQFETRSAEMVEPKPVAERAGAVAPRWPSREPVMDGQISVKAPLDVLDRFKRICKDDRRTYADMLGILMDRYEGK